MIEQQALEVINYDFYRIEVYRTIYGKKFKATVFDRDDRRQYFTNFYKFTAEAIAEAKEWIDTKGR